MPPTGFSQEAINGLLTFVRAAYESALDRYRTNRTKKISERESLIDSVGYLEEVVKSTAPLAVKGTVSLEGIEGLAKFISVNYQELINEIAKGKKKESDAIQKELDSINMYLVQFKLEEK